MTRKLKRQLLLCCLLTAIVAIGPAEADRYESFTFAEAAETSSVIVRGFLVDAFEGRTIRSAAVSSSVPGMRTAFLRIAPMSVLKGNGEDYFLVEVRMTGAVIDDFLAGRYRDDVLLVLSPASNWVVSPEITLSPRARAERALEKPLYEPITPAFLFAMTGTGKVVAPLDRSGMLDELYANFDSIAALESQFAAIQEDQQRQGAETKGGFRDWGETVPVERVETEYAEGLNQWFYPNGQRQFELSVVNGELKEGRHWDQNGQLLMEATFDGGERVGCRAWTPDGAPATCREARPWF